MGLKNLGQREREKNLKGRRKGMRSLFLSVEERGGYGGRRKRLDARGIKLLEQFNEMRLMVRQMSTGKGKWAQFARQQGGASIPGMPALPKPPGGSGKKTGKAARKEKRRHKAKSGRR